jgi:hypothetical protein
MSYNQKKGLMRILTRVVETAARGEKATKCRTPMQEVDEHFLHQLARVSFTKYAAPDCRTDHSRMITALDFADTADDD